MAQAYNSPPYLPPPPPPNGWTGNAAAAPAPARETYGGIDNATENGIAGTSPQFIPIQTICGLRKKTFFIVLAIAITLVVAGFSAGLGVALGRRNNSAKADDIDNPSAPSPSNPNANPDASLPAPPEASRFALSTGLRTITLTKYSTSGGLCNYFTGNLFPTTVIRPLIAGDTVAYSATWTGSSTTVEQRSNGPPMTVTVPAYSYTATAIYTRIAPTVHAWNFLQELAPALDLDCKFKGLFQLIFENSGVVRYTYTVILTDISCVIAEQPFVFGSHCYQYYEQ